MEIRRIRQYIRGIQQWRLMLPRIRLTQDTAENLLYIDRRGAVRKRGQNIRKRAVPALFQCVDRNNVPNLTSSAHKVLPLKIVYVGSLDRNLFLRNAHRNQHRLDPVEGVAVVLRARLSLKQHDRPDIRTARLFCGYGLLLNTAAKLNCVLNDALTRGSVVNNRQFDHMLFLEFPRVNIGDNIAVLAWRCRQIENKGRIQVVQHLGAEVRTGVVAFVHNDNRFQMAKHLNQCRIRRIGQQHIFIFEILGKAEQIAVLLINLADILFLAVDAQRTVAHHADGQHLPNGIRRKILSVQQHFLCVDTDTTGELLIEPLTIRMINIRQILNGLRQDRIAGNQPDNKLRLAGRQSIENALDRCTGHKGLAAAGRHLHTDMRNAVNRVVIGRYTAQSYGNIFFRPVIPPSGK